MPYLKAMKSYVQFGARVWYSVTDEHGRFKQRLKEETFDFLNYKVKSWQESLPEILRPSEGELRSLGENILSDSRKAYFLRSVFFLRANQIRILVLRPLLYSHQTARANPSRVGTLVQLTTSTIDKLIEMDHQTNLYRTQIPILNHFLSSALCSLFLVLAHYSRPFTMEPSSNEITSVIDAIANGLGMLRSYLFSQSSQRLLRNFTGPQGLMSHLGLLQNCNRFDNFFLETLNIDTSPDPNLVVLDQNAVLEGVDYSPHGYSNPARSEGAFDFSLTSPVMPGDISQLFAGHELDFMGPSFL